MMLTKHAVPAVHTFDKYLRTVVQLQTPVLHRMVAAAQRVAGPDTQRLMMQARAGIDGP